jgi:hypothetical protein
VLFQEAEEPPRRNAGPSVRSLHGDQRCQFERFEQADATDLACRRFSDQQVSALECSLEDGPRVTLCCRA